MSQAQQSGLSVMPDRQEEGISATDQGITVPLAQTLMDRYSGRLIFRMEGLDLEEGQLPWPWFDFTIDGKPLDKMVNIGLGTEFFTGIAWDEEGNLVYAKDGKSASAHAEN